MKSVNRATLLGNVGRDPEIKVTGSGTSVANFSIATSERYKDKSGEWQDRTEWHNVVAYGRPADIIRDYVRKGSKLYVEGRIQTRSWDGNDGAKHYRTEIVVDQVVLLSGGEKQSSDDRYERGSYDQRREPQRGDGFGSQEVNDDDIPF
jgi:single-strand DNA-binding protein